MTHFRFTADQKFYPRKFFISPSKAPLDFSGGPLKHFWNSRLASARKEAFGTGVPARKVTVKSWRTTAIERIYD